MDVEDEIDVDGNDEEVFGRAQFTEVDILSASTFMRSSGGSGAAVKINIVDEASTTLAKHPSSDSQPVSPPTLLATSSH